MSPHQLTIALIALAGVTRVAAALVLGDRLHFVDEAIYLDAARSLLAGHGYGESYANVPGQPVFLAILAAPWSSSLMLVRCAHALVTGVGGAALLHVLGTRTLGVTAAGVALVLYALDPLVVVAGALLYPEGIAAVVLTATLAAAVIAAQDDNLTASAATGIALGTTILFRPVALVLVALIALWIAATVVAPVVRRATHAAVMLLACGFALMPWMASNLAHDGHLVPAGLAGLQNAPVPRTAVAEQGLAVSIGHAAVSNPRRIIRRVGNELAAFWELYPTRLQTDSAEQRESIHRDDSRLPSETSFPPSLRDTVSAISFGAELAFAVLGLAIGFWRRPTATALLVGVAFLYGLGYALFLAKLRYRIVVLPGVFLLAGFAAATLYEVTWGRRGARAA